MWRVMYGVMRLKQCSAPQSAKMAVATTFAAAREQTARARIKACPELP